MVGIVLGLVMGEEETIIRRFGVDYDYVRENGTYLVVNPGDPERTCSKSSIALNMMQSCTIPGLVAMKREQTNLQESFYYDITSKRMLEPLLAGNGITFRDFCQLLYSIVSTISDSALYMLDEQHFLVHEQFIFVGESFSDVQLTYLPIDELPELPDAQSRLLALMDSFASYASHKWDDAGVQFQAMLRQDGVGFRKY